ncbi:MAG: hypothetical protein QNK03_16675 [Myxococcota bacterium]|nr:hypothetical protein [Myxococcota bacterium]
MTRGTKRDVGSRRAVGAGGPGRAARRPGWLEALALLVALLLLASAPAAAREGEESGAIEAGRKAFDAAILRPLQAVQVVVSAVILVPAYPVSWLFGGEEDVLDLCISEPIERLRRPLGEL